MLRVEDIYGDVKAINNAIYDEYILGEYILS